MKRIKVTNLFGQFNHEINLNPDGISIITGPNGYGKSTLLRMINSLSSGLRGLIALKRIKFDKFTIETEKDEFCIEKNLDEISINGIKTKNLEKTYRNLIRKNNRYVIPIDEKSVLDRRSNMLYTVDEYIDKCLSENAEFYDYDIEDRNISAVISELKRVSSVIGKIYFLEEQRLIKNIINPDRLYMEKQTVNVIDELPDKMKKIFTDYTTKYSINAADLDSSYPNRLFTVSEELSEESYNSEMAYFNEKFEKMSKYKLATTPIRSNCYQKEFAKALKIYFEDFRKKYDIYGPFIEKLDLFTDIVNSRLHFKSINVSKEKGISILKNETNEEIPLGGLSSGEKQEIVLFFDLIFESDNNSILLIDEPEISLHVSWQKRFIDDLIRVLKIKSDTAIIATHSPQIIDSHWDIITDLGEQYEFNKEKFE